MYKNKLIRVSQSFAPGLVVFLVALPLCLGISLASGVPPIAGIISGVIGGIVVGMLSNSSISVSGPAAGLSAILFSAITELGSFELLLCACVIASVIQLILGFLKSGSIANFFPSNVIEGMLAGIGLVILIKQIPLVLGVNSLRELNLDEIHIGSIILSLLSLGILIIWNKSKRTKNLKFLPSALIVVAFGVGLNQLWRVTNSSLMIEVNQLVSIPVINNLSDFSSIFVFPDLAGFLNPAVWVIGLTIAVVASIETLLCIEAADRLDPLKRHTNPNRELKAQGIGNLLSAIVGGIPMTSVVVRSSANVNAGGISKASTIIHGVLLLLSVLTIPFVLNMIPLASLASVLILIGYNLAKPSVVAHFWKKGYTQFIPFIATLTMVVLTDLLIGVIIGVALSILFLLFGNIRKAYTLEKRIEGEKTFFHLKLAEEVSFLNKAALKNKLSVLPNDCHLIIDAKRVGYIHVDIIETVEDFINDKAKQRNITISTNGFFTKVESSLGQSNINLTHRKTI